MKEYLWLSGGLIILVMVLIVFAGGTYQKHLACEHFFETYGYPSAAPETTSTAVVPDWQIHADCQGVQNDLYVAYYFIALGVALFAAAFIRR